MLPEHFIQRRRAALGLAHDEEIWHASPAQAVTRTDWAVHSARGSAVTSHDKTSTLEKSESDAAFR